MKTLYESLLGDMDDIIDQTTIYGFLDDLNKDKKNLATVCFDMHSDTYDYNDFLWKGNSCPRNRF